MTRTEKLTAINQRLAGFRKFDFPEEISVMLIVNMLDSLKEKGLVDQPYSISQLGKDIIAICEEFDWEITDADIQIFCDDLVEPGEVKVFVHIIKQLRDKISWEN